ncbi:MULTISPECIES: hypothetical protein [Methanosarcina]|uniref:hypothetical protein n=1 Tax=Methanosarcina TaxID=2207 RepID=UPI00114D2DD6|nr:MULTISPECIES: hypothetical protein [Methanosarcina]
MSENSSNDIVGVINRHNGCSTTILKKSLSENLSNDVIIIVTVAYQWLHINGANLWIEKLFFNY